MDARVTIREAEVKDMDYLLQFEQGVIKAERPFDPTLKPDNTAYYDLPELIQDDDTLLLVAEASGKAVGAGYARIKDAKKYLRHDRYAYLGFMYVTPEYRGQGINQKIIDKLIEWSKARGLSEIRLEVYDDNEAAIRAYKKVGFVPHMLEMRIVES